jgi:hypothetical protein
MAGQLQRLNGWRRLWLVATVVVAIWFVVVWPVQVLKEMEVSRYSYDRDTEKEFESGQCRAYQTEALGKLREPGYSEGCYHIYLSRKYDSTAPYTLEAYKRSNSGNSREQYLYALAIGAAGTAVLSALVYFFGWLVAWILAGFRQQRQP